MFLTPKIVFVARLSKMLVHYLYFWWLSSSGISALLMALQLASVERKTFWPFFMRFNNTTLKPKVEGSKSN